MQSFSCLITWCTPMGKLNVHQLVEFVISISSQGGDKKLQLMSKPVQFTGVHFPDLNSKFLWQLKQHEIRVKCLAPVRFKWPWPKVKYSTRNFSLKIRVITEFFSASFKVYSPAYFQKWKLLRMSCCWLYYR